MVQAHALDVLQLGDGVALLRAAIGLHVVFGRVKGVDLALLARDGHALKPAPQAALGKLPVRHEIFRRQPAAALEEVTLNVVGGRGIHLRRLLMIRPEERVDDDGRLAEWDTITCPSEERENTNTDRATRFFEDKPRVAS